MTIKSFGAGAWAFLLGNRWARIALAVVPALMLGHCGLSYVEGLKRDRDQSKARLVICQQASQSQVATIERMSQAQAANALQYQRQIAESAEQVERLEAIDRQRETETNEKIRQLRQAAQGNECANTNLPADIADRLRND